MAAANNQVATTLSLLDRLTEKEGPLDPWAGLCRDLAALLNTRRAGQDFDASYVQATNSLLCFGVVDFTAYNLKNELDQEHVRLSIERAIRQFEPRLSHVAVSMEEPDPLKPVLRFQISAMLRFENPGEPVLFDVTLHRDARRFSVSGANP
jgi:type VI secretion system protein ImpF